MGERRYLVLYDGVCGLCNQLVQWILPRDADGRFGFAPLQSQIAADLLERHRIPGSLDTFVLIERPGGEDERALTKWRAARRVLTGLGGGWAVWGLLAALVPSFLGDRLYELVAARRYAWFGQADACLLPAPEQQKRFLGLEGIPTKGSSGRTGAA